MRLQQRGMHEAEEAAGEVLEVEVGVC